MTILETLTRDEWSDLMLLLMDRLAIELRENGELQENLRAIDPKIFDKNGEEVDMSELQETEPGMVLHLEFRGEFRKSIELVKTPETAELVRFAQARFE